MAVAAAFSPRTPAKLLILIKLDPLGIAKAGSLPHPIVFVK